MIQASPRWVIPFTLLAALVVYALPLPFEWRWYRPEWPMLVSFYWSLALPHRVGIVSAAAVGFALDLLDGITLGLQATGMVASTLFLLLNYQRIRQFDGIQQSLVVTLLVALTLVIEQWLRNLLGIANVGLEFLYSLVLTALMWPIVRNLLRGLRRHYEVS